MLETREEYVKIYREERLDGELFDDWIDRTGRRKEWADWVETHRPTDCEDGIDPRIFLKK